MRNEHKQHQQQYHHQLQHKGTFMPMLCSKPSMIKDVHIPNPFNKDRSSSGRCLANDPSLSPKVGCMGQVKKKDHQHHTNYNYKLGMVFPTTTTNNSTTSSYYTTKNPNTEVGHGSNNNNLRYSKLLKLFSSKTLLATPLPSTNRKEKTSSTRLRSRSCEDNRGVIGLVSRINVADMDPPLPVVIKGKASSSSSSLEEGQVRSEGDNNKTNSSLWMRRSGGAALKGLEIQQV